MATNNVHYIRPAVTSEQKAPHEPTPLQQEVFARARELRELEREREQTRPEQWRARWVVSGVLAIAAFGLMFGVIDVVLTKMQQLLENVAFDRPAPTEPAPVSTSPDQPYFIELNPPPVAEEAAPAAGTPSPQP